MIFSLAPVNLKDKRQALRSQRRWQAVQSCWQVLLITALAGGLASGLALPHWHLQEPKQINVQGNQLITDDKIRNSLSLSYPQSLWQLKTHELASQLQDLPPIASVLLTREIFPPQLTVKIKERQPVAIAHSSQGDGFLDPEGIFIPKNFYHQDAPELKNLPLKVIGFEPQYGTYWRELYPVIVNSPVKILAVDWSSPSNIVLISEVGKVHFGSNNAQFPEKLTVLARMKRITSKVAKERIIYIDLTNPSQPTVKLKPEAPQATNTNLVRTQ